MSARLKFANIPPRLRLAVILWVATITSISTDCVEAAALQPGDIVVADVAAFSQLAQNHNGYVAGAVFAITPPSGAPVVITKAAPTDALPFVPSLVALPSDGSILIIGHAQLVRVDPATGEQTIIPWSPPNSFLYGLAIDSSGQVLIATAANGTTGITAILKVNPATGSQTILSQWPYPQPYDAPKGLAIDLNGRILATSFSGAIYQIDPSTGARTVISPAQNQTSGSIAVDQNGRIFAVGNPADIYRIDPSSGSRTTITSGGFLEYPVGLAVEASGSLLVADRTGVVVRVDPTTGTQTLVASGAPLSAPFAVAVVKPLPHLTIAPTAAQIVINPSKMKWRPEEHFLIKGIGFAPPPANPPQFKFYWSQYSNAQFQPVLGFADSWTPGATVQPDGSFTVEYNVPANVKKTKQTTAGNARIEINGSPTLFTQINVDGTMIDAGCGLFDGQQIITSAELTGGTWAALTREQRIAAINASLAQNGGSNPKALANINLETYYPGLGQTAAEIIENSGTQNAINPQIIITMMEKEQQLVSGNYSRSIPSALNYAMGRGSASAFADQVDQGADDLRAYFDGLSDQSTQYTPADLSTPWRVGDCHWLMTGDTGVGSDSDGDVTSGVSGWLAPGNAATAALWVYNPVFPNRRFGSNYDFWRIWHRFGFASSLSSSCAGTLVLRAFSPVRVVLRDPQGRRAGIDPLTGTPLTEIPGSSVSTFPDGAQFISVPSAPDGTYRIDIEGVAGGGDYLLTFDSVTPAGTLASSDFGSVIHDGEQQSLAIAYTASSGALLVAALKLNASLQNGAVTLSWTADQDAFTLEQSPQLAPFVWSAVPHQVGFTNGSNSVTLDATNGLQFFRLRKN